eukprot:jgi/Botrbrau1/20300/Bobra.31_1s0077.1
MSEPDPKSRSLVNTVVQCELLQKTKYIHEIISSFPELTNRDMADCISNPRCSALLVVAATDLQKLARKVVKMHQSFKTQLADPLKITSYGNLEGRALLDHESIDEQEMQVEQPTPVEQQKPK